MYTFTKPSPQPDIRLQSSLAEIGEKLHVRGVLADPSDTVENVMYRSYVLEPHITRMTQIEQVLRQLDVDSKMSRKKTGCAKAQSTRDWMAQEHGGAPDVTWAIMGLALARHKKCDCHETGSLQPVRRGHRARLGVKASILDILAYYLRSNSK